VKRRYLVFSLLATIVLAGCHSGQKAATQGSAGANIKVYHLRGKVVSTDVAKGEATLNHEAIAGLMDAMTMPYKLKDPGMLGQLHPDDTITADVLISQDPNADMLLDHIVVVAQAKPAGRPGGAH
jgi:protein SCO1/2